MMFSLKLFGGASLAGETGPLSGPAAQRHRLALLALLATTHPGGLSRDKLMACLWPERDTEHARQLLNQAVYALRRALGEEAILSAGEELRLGSALMSADVIAFEEARAAGDLERAVALYQGPFLDGFFLSDSPEFERWVERERERLADAYARALEALAEAAEARGDFGRAVERWKARAAHDSYDSRVALRLMQALDTSGNRAGALQHAAIHQRLLQAEFGVEPPPEVRALTEWLRSEPVAEAPASSQWAEPPGGRKMETPTAPNDQPEVSAPVDASPVRPTYPSWAGAGEGGRKRRQRWVVAAALLALLSVVGAVWAVWPRGTEPEPSIVVLPFLNLSLEDNEFFSDGLTEEIITRLSAVPELKVISRTSAMHYKGSEQPLRQIADELNVAHVLEGSVRQSEGRLRITAQLIDARTDQHLWAENYDYELRDIFRVQEEIASQVVRALEVKLGERERTQLERQGTRDPEAYQLYRRGRYLWGTRTKEGHEQAIEYYRRAIERDSTYADAYAGMADAYLTMFQLYLSCAPEAEVYSRVKWAAERALALDDRSSDAHTSFAIALWWQRNWPGAERELRRAIELNPGNSTARGWYWVLLAGWGRLEEGRAEARRAYELDPFAPVSIGHLGLYCYLARDYDCGIEQYRKAIEINPSFALAHQRLGLIYSQKGMAEEALRAFRKAAELSPAYLPDVAYGLALAGKRQEALETLDRAKERPFEPFYVSRAFVALGEPDSAFVWLERSNWRWPNRANRYDPALDPLRSDPRFAQLSLRIEREMGLR